MNNKKLLFIIGILILLVGVGYFFANRSREQKQKDSLPLTKISLALDWLPSAYHAPLFLAKEKGYFKDNGLDIEFRIPSDLATVLQTVAAGKDDFGLNYPTEVLAARDKGIPVVSIMALIQHPLISFAALKDSGIVEPKDLAGKKIGLSAIIPTTENILDTMLKKQGKSIKDTEIIDVGYDVIPSLIGKKVDAVIVYWGTETVLLESQGFSINTMRAQDYGVPDYYELIFITNEEKISKNPNLVQRFVVAVSKGYKDALENPRAALDAMKKEKPEVDYEFQTRSMDSFLPLIRSVNDLFGWQEEEKWVNFANWMKDNGLISKDLDVKAAFDNSFVENAVKE